MIVGTLSQIAVPDATQLATYTEQVVANNGMNVGSKIRTAGTPPSHVIPLRPGDPTPIKHVIYVIKENRTFDQVFGSLGKGNGDPSLNLFGDESAPNQRALEKQFVTLDNFYSDAEVSADGWNWATGAEANSYVQHNWPADYNDRNRPYDFEGGNLATSPGTDPTDAFIWNKLSDNGISYRNYGFRVFGGQVASTEPRLAENTDLNFAGYNLSKPDSIPDLIQTGVNQPTRIAEWLKEFNQYEATGTLPTVEFVRLPNDHTATDTPGAPTPRAYMADNDYALGQLVDAVSHSADWGSTAIFVIEDDAQEGPDHVDAHRTIAQVISPYTQTGQVDSTFYSQVSVLRTIEQIVGIAPMTQFDAAATPLLNSFTDTPNTTPYTAIVPTQDVHEKNPVTAQHLSPFSSLDQIANEVDWNEALENQGIWKSIYGWNSTMPEPKTQFRSVSVTVGSSDEGATPVQSSSSDSPGATSISDSPSGSSTKVNAPAQNTPPTNQPSAPQPNASVPTHQDLVPIGATAALDNQTSTKNPSGVSGTTPTSETSSQPIPGVASQAVSPRRHHNSAARRSKPIGHIGHSRKHHNQAAHQSKRFGSIGHSEKLDHMSQPLGERNSGAPHATPAVTRRYRPIPVGLSLAAQALGLPSLGVPKAADRTDYPKERRLMDRNRS
jgi:phospholipase C